MIAKLAITKPKHEAVAQGIEIVGGRYSQLRDTRPGCGTKSGKTSSGWRGEGRPGGITRSSEIHMEVVNVVFAAAWIADEGLGGARRGQRGAVEVSRQKGGCRPAQRSCRTDEGRRGAREHFRPIEGERLRPEKTRAGRVKDIHAHVVGIGPHCELRIVEEVRAQMKAIPIITPGCIARSGDRDAFVRRDATASKLADDPPAG